MSDKPNWDDNDALFMRELSEGAYWMQQVVERLHAAGIICRSTPSEFREDKADRKRFEGERDIAVRRNGAECTLESKSRNLTFFDNPSSFPFDTIIVDRVSVWEKKDPEPRAVVFTSQWTGGMIVLPVRTTKEHWFKQVKRDTVREIDSENYMVKREDLCSFGALVKWLKQ